MKALVLMAAALLSACTAGGAGSYDLPSGVADYDALKAATDKCKEDGGVLALKKGYDEHDLSSYECRVGGGK